MEMKTNKPNSLQLSLCALLVALLYACSGSVDETYTNAIPADATFVASINVNDLVKKADYKDFNEVGKAIGGVLSQGSTESLSLLSDIAGVILSNPKESGLDFDAPVYLFQQPDGASMGIVIRVTDREKVQAWVESTVGAPGSDSVTFVDYNESGLCIYEKKGKSQWQMPATPEARFNQSASFKKMRETKGDLRYWFNTRDLVAKYGAHAITTQPPLYTETGLVGACNFEKGAFSATAALVANTPAAEEGIAALKKALRPSKGKFISYLPESTTVMASVCGTGADYLEYINRTPGLGAMYGGNYRFWQAMLQAIDGEAVIALTKMAEYSISFIAYAELKPDVDEAQMREILSRNSLQNSHWGIKDHCLYLTNDKELSENAFKDASPSLRKAEYGKQSDGKPVYLLMDIAKIMSNPVLGQALAQMGNNGPLQYYALMGGMEYELNEDYELVMKVSLKDKQENVLKMLVGVLTK